jgi:putative endonuclease
LDNWYTYILECADASLYTGITNDIGKRLAKHNSGKASKYTRARLPVVLRAYWLQKDKGSALKEEARIKKLSRADKLKLISCF